jgi:adenylate kinase
MYLVLLGIAGSGKGTLAKQLVSKYNYRTLTTGELYRTEASLGTEFGLKAKEYWGNGNLCPDEMTNELMRKYVSDLAGGNVIFDGYPRTAAQAVFLDGIAKIDLVLDLHISDDVAVKRLLRRGLTENRPDDTEEVITQRLKVYHANNIGLVEYYKGRMREGYIKVDSDRPVEDVFKSVEELLMNG